jgi:hypothetical protein
MWDFGVQHAFSMDLVINHHLQIADIEFLAKKVLRFIKQFNNFYKIQIMLNGILMTLFGHIILAVVENL